MSPRAYWRGKKVWIAWKDPDLGPQRKPSPARTLAEGKQLAHEKERAAWRRANNLEPEFGPDKTFRERAEEWLAQLPKEYRSKSTARAYLTQRILPFLGHLPSRAVTREHVRAMLLANEKDRVGTIRGRGGKTRPFVLRGASPATREKLRVYVHAIYTWLIDDLEEVHGRNPAGGKRMRVRVPKRLPRYIPVTELVALMRHVDRRHLLLFVWQLVMATRRSEALPLTWDELDLPGRVARIQSSKTSTERLVPIPEWFAKVLADEKEKRRSIYVFPNDKGGRQRHDTKTARIIQRAAARAGLVLGYLHKCRRQGCGFREMLATQEPRPCPNQLGAKTCGFRSLPVPIPKRYLLKDLRSSFATLVAAETGDLRMVQLVLGHGSVRTTEQNYVHAMTAPLLAKTDALQVFGPVRDAVRDLCASSEKEAAEDPIQAELTQQDTQ